MQTYEISKYEKKLRSNSSTKNLSRTSTGSVSNYNYDSYFNMNLQNNVTFEHMEIDELLRAKDKEAKKLRLENAHLYEQAKSIEDQLKKAKYDNSMLFEDYNALNEEKKDLLHTVNEYKQKFNNITSDNILLKNRLECVMDDLSKAQNGLKGAIEENGVLRNEIYDLKQKNTQLINEVRYAETHLSPEAKKIINQYQDEIGSIKNQLDKIYTKNKELQEQLCRNKAIEDANRELVDENLRLKSENQQVINNSNALINDLKNEIDLLRNHTEILEKEKKNLEKSKASTRKTNDEIIKEANKKITHLEKENEDLNRRALDHKKLNQALLREKDSLVSQLRQLEKEIRQSKPNNQMKDKLKSENLMFIECLKNENEELKMFYHKHKRLLDMLFHFINNLNLLFGREEQNIEHCKDYPEDLQENLRSLERDIENLFNDKNHSHDSKWKHIEEKLRYKPNEENKKDIPKEQLEDYKLGRCSSCDLGCNTSLKGSSPYFTKRNTNPTNLPQNNKVHK